MSGKVAFNSAKLRDHLIKVARHREITTYGEVGKAFGYPTWSQGHTVALVKTLNALGRENRLRHEPMLMALVVAKSTKLPGPGFFSEVAGTGSTQKRHRDEVERVHAYAW